jgi:23S rRNA (pseudouridine1915-N3)-methyltransferase
VGRELVIVWAGRHRRPEWEALYGPYRRRIERAMAVREVAVRVRRADPGPRLREEGEAILAALPDPVWLVALDERGEALSSQALAAELARLAREWPHPVAFAVGSDEGLDPAVLARARRVLSFGPATLSHELARLVLYEQLYRALAIAAGSGYHRP